jgi:hypothetical protein
VDVDHGAGRGCGGGGCSAEHRRGSLRARRADALVALARAELSSDSCGIAGGDPVEVTVHVDVETLAADEIGDRCELTGGPSIAPETVRRLGCDPGVVRILERDGRPLSVGRRTRTVPPALKRALSDRDRCCRFPGCDHERYLHAHHIRHWARGGPTSLANLVHLCSYHHRLVHEGGFAAQRTPAGGVGFCRPDGRPIPPSTRPPADPKGSACQSRTGSAGSRSRLTQADRYRSATHWTTGWRSKDSRRKTGCTASLRHVQNTANRIVTPRACGDGCWV